MPVSDEIQALLAKKNETRERRQNILESVEAQAEHSAAHERKLQAYEEQLSADVARIEKEEELLRQRRKETDAVMAKKKEEWKEKMMENQAIAAKKALEAQEAKLREEEVAAAKRADDLRKQQEALAAKKQRAKEILQQDAEKVLEAENQVKRERAAAEQEAARVRMELEQQKKEQHTPLVDPATKGAVRKANRQPVEKNRRLSELAAKFEQLMPKDESPELIRRS
eukprot:m.1639195 g.1639195  ORF g.1639195 m.1639195 type:complete len:226 (-) comp33668_c0_seq1:309-986(-)